MSVLYACKVETIEFDAKIIHDPDFAPTTGSRFKTFGLWQAWLFETCGSSKVQPKAQATKHQAPKGKDTSPRSQGGFLEYRLGFWTCISWSQICVSYNLSTLSHAAP